MFNFLLCFQKIQIIQKCINDICYCCFLNFSNNGKTLFPVMCSTYTMHYPTISIFFFFQHESFLFMWPDCCRGDLSQLVLALYFPVQESRAGSRLNFLSLIFLAFHPLYLLSVRLHFRMVSVKLVFVLSDCPVSGHSILGTISCHLFIDFSPLRLSFYPFMQVYFFLKYQL